MSGIVDPSTPEREAVLAAWNDLFTVCAQLTFNIADVDDVRVCAEKVESAIYARALADVAGWVEGMQVVHTAECVKAAEEFLYEPLDRVCSCFATAHNQALDALLAKLREAK